MTFYYISMRMTSNSPTKGLQRGLFGIRPSLCGICRFITLFDHLLKLNFCFSVDWSISRHYHLYKHLFYNDYLPNYNLKGL